MVSEKEVDYNTVWVFLSLSLVSFIVVVVVVIIVVLLGTLGNDQDDDGNENVRKQ